jgi:anthranilate phosphoribosyltransferase
MHSISLAQLITQLAEKRDLSAEHAQMAAALLAQAEVDFDDKYTFLLRLAEKGVTVEELAAIATYFRGCAIDPGVDAWAQRAIDVCGTGGDNAGTFNISTAVSFVVAACGVPVFKHGNRSITSKCGSADLLQALGFPLTVSREVIHQTLAQFNYAFFFAPDFHPAFKEVMPVRRALAEAGKRTVFNLLGPMINPGKPAFQLMGVFDRRWLQPLAASMATMGSRGGWIVHGEPEPGRVLDELSCAGCNYAYAYGDQGMGPVNIQLLELGLETSNLSQLLGGDAGHNCRLLLDLLSPSAQWATQGLQNSVWLNAGAALLVAGKVQTHQEGVELAKATIASGRVGEWLHGIQDFYQSIR